MIPHSSTLAWTERLHVHFSHSCIGEGNGNPLQCSCLENPRDGGAWWAAVYGVAQSRTRLKRLSSSSRVRWWGASAGMRSAPHPAPAPPAGPQFWSFQDLLLDGAARPLTELGLPPEAQVDAVSPGSSTGRST